MGRSRRPLVPTNQSDCVGRSMRRLGVKLASWRYPDAWDMLMFGLRLGDDPRVVVTTTPKPTKIIRELIADPTTRLTRGSSYENRRNLAKAFFSQIVRKYEGTRIGRQELNAEILDDVPGALWTRELLEELRWPAGKRVPDLSRVVVAIDPAATSGEEADETGIIVAGRDYNGHGYVLDEFPSVGGDDAGTRAAGTMPPGTRVLSRYRRHTNTLASLRQS